MNPFLCSLELLLIFQTSQTQLNVSVDIGEDSSLIVGSITIPADSLYVGDISVKGDAFIDGTVDGNITVTEGTVSLSGSAEGDVVVFGGSFDLGGVIRGDVALFGSDGTITGEVKGDVVVLGGNLDIGPNTSIEGDLTIIGGEVKKDSAAVIRGKEEKVELGVLAKWLERLLAKDWKHDGAHRTFPFSPKGPLLSPGARAAVHLVLYALLYLLTLLFIVLFPRWHNRSELLIERNVWKMLLTGVVYRLAVAGIFVVLVISVIGWFLVPFALLGLALIALMGTGQTAIWLGTKIKRWFKMSTTSRAGTYSLGFLGIYLVSIAGLLLSLLGNWANIPGRALKALGFLIIFAGMTLGRGGIIYSLLFRREAKSLGQEADESKKR